jgi:uncharacterized protein DUF3761
MTRLRSLHRHLLILAVALPAALSCRASGPVTCSDGTTSAPGKDACSNHGGVQTAAATTGAKHDSTAVPSKPAPAPSAAANAEAPGTETSPAAPASGPTPEAALLGQSAPTAQPPTPAGATAECKDGTYSTSKPSSTTCSKHGGVKKLLKQ